METLLFSTPKVWLAFIMIITQMETTSSRARVLEPPPSQSEQYWQRTKGEQTLLVQTFLFTFLRASELKPVEARRQKLGP